MDSLPHFPPASDDGDPVIKHGTRLWRLGAMAARALPLAAVDGFILSQLGPMAVVHDERAGNVLVHFHGEVVYRGTESAVEVYRPGSWENALEQMARIHCVIRAHYTSSVLGMEAAMRTYQQLCPRCGALCTVEVHHRNGRARRETTCHRCRHRRGGRLWRLIVTLAVLALWGYAAYSYTELWLSGAW